MKRFAVAAFAGLTMAFSSAAWANGAYKAELNFDQGLPGLRTGSPTLDGMYANVDGDWTTLGRRQASATARDQVGYDASGHAVYSSTYNGTTSGRRNYQNAWHTLGEMVAFNPSLDYRGWGDATIDAWEITATGGHRDEGVRVDTAATWARDFALGAGESFSFSALATLSILGDVAALDTTSWFGVDITNSFASLVLADVADRVRTSLTAAITSPFSGDLGNVFGFSVGADGRLSLTVTNTTASVMTGTLGAGSYVNVSAPVPEPATTALMLLGLGVVGSAARRCRRVI